MNESKFLRFRMVNMLLSFTLYIAMATLLGVLAFIIAGEKLVILTLLFVGIAYIFTPAFVPGLFIRFFKGRAIHYINAPELHRMVRVLSSRAGLEGLPALYYIPSKVVTAFATGDSKKSAIALTYGMLNTLSLREIAGVVSHEISHIRSNDMRGMWFSLVMNRVTGFLSLCGQLLIFINLPLILLSEINIGWFTISILVLAPVMSFFVHMTLSRVREFNADLGGAELMGTPEPLISALAKIEYSKQSLLDFFIIRRKKATDESFLMKTHPPTEERIKRLQKVRERSNRNYFYPKGMLVN